MKISELKKGDFARIISIKKASAQYRHRLLSMGLIPGTRFQLTCIAPLGDPIQISVRDFNLVLRKNEADVIEIEKDDS